VVSWTSDGQESAEGSPEALAEARESLRRAGKLFGSNEIESGLRLFVEVLGRLGFPLDRQVREALVAVVPDLPFTDPGRSLSGERSDRLVAAALFALGEGLSKLGAEDGACAAWNQLAACFGESDDPRVRGVVAYSWMNRARVLQRDKDWPALAVALPSALGYEELRKEKPPEQMLAAFSQLAGELNALGRAEEELEVYDDAVRLYADSEDPEVRVRVQTASVKKAFRLGQLGRMEEANATYAVVSRRYGNVVQVRGVDRAVGSDFAAYTRQAVAEREFQDGKIGDAIELINDVLDDLCRLDSPVALRRRIDCQVLLAQFFQALGDHGSAHVACTRAIDTFEEMRYSDRDPRSIGQAIHALIRDVISTHILGPAKRGGAIERLELILKSLPTDGDFGQKAAITLREGDLAKQLAELQASEWAISMRMADNEPATLREMQRRALALYGAAGPWFEAGFIDPSVDGRAVGAAMMLQTTGDAFALLSREWTDEQRALLPLPSPRVMEQHMTHTGLAEWAEDLGHPLPQTDTSDLLEPAPVRVGGPAPDLLAGFETALTHQQILDRVYTSRAAAAALQITELQRFAIEQLATAQRSTAWAGSQQPSAAAVCVPIVMIARALYTVSHEGATPEFRPIDTKHLLKQTLATPEAQEWLQEHGAAIPDWLVDES
jgi:tetratricopeptide (TPR) repeat protein